MGTTLKAKLVDWLPPALYRAYFQAFKRYGYQGEYRTWEDARRASGGYDADEILERVKASLLKVKRGEAVYERDSVLFDQIQHSFQVLAGLLRAAAESHNRLSVLDFGGSLGSSYYQCRGFLSVLDGLQWSVIEQQKFVDCGRAHFEDEVLKFYPTIDACLEERSPQVLLLSSVIQYLPDPHAWLDEIAGMGFRYILIDITPMRDTGDDRLTIQRVPPSVYEASYPVWLLGRERFLAHLSADYELLAEADSLESYPLKLVSASNKAFIFRRKG